MTRPRVKSGRRMPQNIVADPAHLNNNYCNRVRAAYFRNRRNFSLACGHDDDISETVRIPSWDGGTDKWGTTHPEVWLPLVKFIRVTNDYNIESFITAQFHFLGVGGTKYQPPLPHQFQSSRAVDNYQKYQQDAVNLFRRSLTTQHNIFTDALLTKTTQFPDKMTTEDYWLLILCDTSNALTPLYRYCVALSQAFDNIITVFRPLAYDQFLLDPQNYTTYWTGMIPDELQQPIVKILDVYHQLTNVNN